METTKRTNKGYFTVQGWDRLSCVWYRTGAQVGR